MRRRLVLCFASLTAVAGFAVLGAPRVMAAADPKVDFSTPTTGQQFTVPAGICSISGEVFGAGGGGDPFGDEPGRGGELKGDFDVTPGQLLTIGVGGQGGDDGTAGINGGGAGGSSSTAANHGRGGGGRSEIRWGGTVLLVAGGGGGTGPKLAGGGDGGGGNGTDGGQYGVGPAGHAGEGALTTKAGEGGVIGFSQFEDGQGGWSGQLVKGGDGGHGAVGWPAGGGGGGGGGYYGGGGGAGGGDDKTAGGGGGGSSHVDGSVALKSTSLGVHDGNGSVTLTLHACTGPTSTTVQPTPTTVAPPTTTPVTTPPTTVDPPPTGGGVTTTTTPSAAGSATPTTVDPPAPSAPTVAATPTAHAATTLPFTGGTTLPLSVIGVSFVALGLALVRPRQRAA